MHDAGPLPPVLSMRRSPSRRRIASFDRIFLAAFCAGLIGTAHALDAGVSIRQARDDSGGTRPGEAMRGSAGTAKNERDAASAAARRDPQELWAMTHRATRIIGTDVRNAEGEALGDIKELVIEPRTGEIAYAVVSFGGVLGLGDKLFAVPWKALQLDARDHVFVLDVEKERLRQAPGFDPDRWPDMANAQWNTEVRRFYGQDRERVRPHPDSPASRSTTGGEAAPRR